MKKLFLGCQTTIENRPFSNVTRNFIGSVNVKKPIKFHVILFLPQLTSLRERSIDQLYLYVVILRLKVSKYHTQFRDLQAFYQRSYIVTLSDHYNAI